MDNTHNQPLLPSLSSESISICVRGQQAEDLKDVCRPGHTYRNEKHNGHLDRTSDQRARRFTCAQGWLFEFQ